MRKARGQSNQIDAYTQATTRDGITVDVRAYEIAHATGGLVDTITNLDDKSLAAGTATGFAFSDYSPLALSEALERALNTYRQPQVWQRLVQTGMRQDWSWAASARQYVELYRSTMNQVRRPLVSGNA